MKLAWKSVSNKPTVERAFSAVIAARDEEGAYLLNELHLWNGVQFLSESDGKPLPCKDGCNYFWISEKEMVAPIANAPIDIEFISSGVAA